MSGDFWHRTRSESNNVLSIKDIHQVGFCPGEKSEATHSPPGIDLQLVNVLYFDSQTNNAIRFVQIYDVTKACRLRFRR